MSGVYWPFVVGGGFPYVVGSQIERNQTDRTMYLKYHIGTGGNWTIRQVISPRYAQRSHVDVTVGGFSGDTVRSYVQGVVGPGVGYGLTVVSRPHGTMPLHEADDRIFEDGVGEPDSWDPSFTAVLWPVTDGSQYDGILTNCPAYLLNDEGETIETIRR